MKAAIKSAFLIAILLTCLICLVYAGEVEEAVISDAKIIHNSSEIEMGVKPVTIDGYFYFPLNAVADLFSKTIEWNQAENKLIIRDMSNPILESMAMKIAKKDKRIEELENKIKELENQIDANKRLSLKELQERINYEYGEYEGVTYKALLSGNEDEIRVKVEINMDKDGSSWKRLTKSKREEMLEEICGMINGDYYGAKIKGYVKDISSSKRLLSFYNRYNNEIVIGYYRNFSTISTLEDRFNNDYSGYLNNIHLSFRLLGNENGIKYYADIQLDEYEDKWEKLSDNAVKNFMKKLCSEIIKTFGSDCAVNGYFYDIDSGYELANCCQLPGEEFEFWRE
jgi:hypothetical protein